MLALILGRKAFFELAHGGIVLLNAMREMSPHMQTTLLRFLNDGAFRRVGEDQEIQVGMRIIGATHKISAIWFSKDYSEKISTIVSMC